MCGIAGIVGAADRLTARASIERMVTSLQRRGPDDGGVEEWDQALLGHRRLSILDLSRAGHQPMVTSARDVGLVFNGCIYNFRELRSELRAVGAVFASESDTEVILEGYRAWGIDCLVSRLRGMFAFAIWDEAQKALFLVRDRLGVKPLAYVRRDDVLAFASTPRALRHGGFAREIDDAAVAEFLEFGFVTDARCIYADVSKVAAATIVEWRDGTLRTRTYWSPPAAAASAPMSFQDAVDETERLLLAAVERRLQADVPVGTLLSGGIDSGLVCWAAAEHGARLTAFTVSTPGDPWDESADATATARALGIQQRVLELSPSEEIQIDRLVAAYAEPFACASALGMLQVSEAVAGSARVLLTGDGGDDVFLGYPRHRHLWLAERVARHLPAPLSKQWPSVRNAVPKVGVLRRGVHFLDYCTGGLGAFVEVHDGLPTYRRQGMLGERLRERDVDQRRTPRSATSARNVLAEYLEYDRRTQFVAEYMTKVDGATMYHALEARAPFVDTDLWEFAARLPFDLRLKGGRLKAILREIAARRIGRDCATRQKRGFQIPVHRWIAGRWFEQVSDVLNDSLLARGNWIQPGPVLAELEAARARGWASDRIWYLFVLESWLRHDRMPEAAA
jgi:asparagine synthase (glutamine-hydrolysing)